MTRLIAVCLMVLAGAAQAHSPLRESNPANDAVLAAVPEVLALTFVDGIRLTRVVLSGGDTPVDLDLSSVDGFSDTYALPMPALGAGNFMVEWRGLGVDGHPMQGEFGFTVE